MKMVHNCVINIVCKELLNISTGEDLRLCASDKLNIDKIKVEICI
jgi:hypothetical protein